MFHSVKRISLEHLSDIAWKTEISHIYVSQVQSSLLEECKIFNYTKWHLQTGKPIENFTPEV